MSADNGVTLDHDGVKFIVIEWQGDSDYDYEPSWTGTDPLAAVVAARNCVRYGTPTKPAEGEDNYMHICEYGLTITDAATAVMEGK